MRCLSCHSPLSSSTRSSVALAYCACTLMLLVAGDITRPVRRLRISVQGKAFARAVLRPTARLRPKPNRERRRHDQRRADADDAGRPSEAIEHLSQHRATGKAAEKIAGEIRSAGDAAIVVCRLPDKA